MSPAPYWVERALPEFAGKLTVEFLDPEAGDSTLAQETEANYGFQPMAASLFDINYFYLTLTDGETVVQMPLPEPRSAEATKRGIEEGLRSTAWISSSRQRRTITASPHPRSTAASRLPHT